MTAPGSRSKTEGSSGVGSDGAVEARAPDAHALRTAIERAEQPIWQTQRADGAWDSPGDMGTITTAQAVITLQYIGRLEPKDAEDATRFLRGQQKADGSFVLYPGAAAGDLGATACAWGALQLAATPENKAASERARAYIDAHGGLDAVVAAIETGDFSAIFLALLRLVDPHALPCPSVLPLLVPPVLRFMQTRFHSGIFMSAFAFGVLIPRLRGEKPHPRLLSPLIKQGCTSLLSEWQNSDGSWLDSVVFTSLLLPALLAADLGPHDPRVRRGGDWLLSRGVRDLAGLHFDAFGMEVWVTTFQLRALLASGVPASDADVVRGLDWLVGAQSFIPVPIANNRKPNGLRSGGWALESSNHKMIDCDDTGVVLSTFGMALRGLASDHPARARLQSSSDRARAWLLDMQNPDGGWSAYVWNLPGKAPGPTLETTPRVRLDDLAALVRLALRPPASMSDPSTEDVTARVLHGLAELGATIQDPAIARSVEFLRVQQCASGAWWGRWGVNYIWGTTFTLWALAAVGADLSAEWVRRGIRWLRSAQNPDGGWGEGPESYRTESRAGVGPSMPALTGLAVCALIECGECDSPEVLRGIRYLLDEQRPDGTWLNRSYLHTNVPPDTFYVLPAAAQFYPLEALGRYQAHHAPGAPKHRPAKWNDLLLDGMRQIGDPEADAVVRSVYDNGSVDGVNVLMGAIFRSDEAVPPALPQAVRSYLERDDVLPSWADPAQIAVAHALFERAGWQIAAGLFCSSLPQAYAAASGAHVIAQTQALTRHVKQRVFETAQFLFDTMDHGGLARSGRGVRSAQKVRLMHAGIRHLLVQRETPVWNAQKLGIPINQEDLAGTLMTFSIVTLDALERLGVEVSGTEARAWLHTWKVVGSVLGVREDMLPADVADARALMDAIRGRQWASSKDGKQLVVPLIEMMQSYFPGAALDSLPIALIRHLAGDHCADLLGLPKTDCVLLLVEGVRVYDALRDVLGFDDQLDALFAQVSHTLMKGIVSVEREGKQARFRIPKSLLDSLGDG